MSNKIDKSGNQRRSVIDTENVNDILTDFHILKGYPSYKLKIEHL